MEEPLLSSLCSICHINAPKYTCPRCSVQTCSLPCSRRHKLWSDCNGIRDPTVFKSRAELATPSGIDHDYNFLHSIEHRIERSEKEIIEDRRLLKRKDLQDARQGEGANSERGSARTHRYGPGEENIEKVLKTMATRVHSAPKGMRRNVENTTSWSRPNRCINWQVEWMWKAGTERVLGKILGNKSIEYYYDLWYDEEKRVRMSDDERKADKKRKAGYHKSRQAKRAKLEAQGSLSASLSTSVRLQDPATGMWSMASEGQTTTNVTQAWAPETYDRKYHHQLYLLRPLTPATFPKVLTPIDPSRSLTDILQGRELLEFPTIYVFEDPLDVLPKQFMLEKDFLVATKQSPGLRTETASDDASTEDSTEEDDTSTDSSDDEEGEIVS